MTWVFIFRLVVAGLLGTVVGIEREWRVKEAGFRTHFLVSLGSALFMIDVYLSPSKSRSAH